MRTRELRFALIALTAFLPEPARAFTLIVGTAGGDTIVTKGWQKDQVVFDLDGSCEPYAASVSPAIEKALSFWNSIPSANLTVSLGARVTLPLAVSAYVGENATDSAPAGNPIVYCDAQFEANSGMDASRTPGFAGGYRMRNPSGVMVGALLVLNVQEGARANVTTYDAELSAMVLAHEVGHVLGLGHSADSNALMYYQTDSSRELAISKDDLDGITYLYPREEPGSGAAFGCGTVRDVNGGHQGGGSGGLPSAAWEFAILIAGFAALWRSAGSRCRLSGW